MIIHKSQCIYGNVQDRKTTEGADFSISELNGNLLYYKIVECFIIRGVRG